MLDKSKIAKAVQYSLLCGSIAVSSAAWSQEAQDALDEDEVKEDVEKVVVTGSRLRKQEFSSASPIQIIDGDLSRELGLFDAGEMLQQSSQSAGTQIDNTFNGFVLDNGPGAQTIGYRGLGAERTLVLINGRRIAPAGVGGAPVAADLALIPGVMIQRVESLLDGASTVYGSDAVAGVANVILKKDVEGFEVEASFSNPMSGGGDRKVLSMMYGTSSDNGFISAGLEYNEVDAMSFAQSEFFSDCEGFYYESNIPGEILSGNRGLGPLKSNFTNCDIFPLTNRISIPWFGSVYYTPGSSNIGVPNYSESSIPTSLIGLLPSWVAGDSNGDGIDDMGFIDGDGDGYLDFDFQDPFYNYQRSAYYNSGDFVRQNRRISAIVNGEYDLGGESNTKLFFEGLYATRNSDGFSPGGQFFPFVPASNPYNPCGTDAINAVDCRAGIGFPYGPQGVTPIVNIRGDRDYETVDVSQYRAVAGLTGDVRFMDDVGAGNWIYEAYVSLSGSKGENSTWGIHEDRLAESLAAVRLDDGTISCGEGCVPVNLFASNIFQEGGGSFTAEEAAFLFAERYMETKITQRLASAYIAGDLMQLPWNDEVVPAVFGVEFRRDEIISNPNDVTSQGLLMHFFADQGADGSRTLREFFTEMEFPLLKGHELAEELTVSASGRWTDESYYAPATTYNVKAIYRPNEWLTFRGTQGSSYRAPNLRERFLNGTTGFNNVFDPCVVPEGARAPSDPSDVDSAQIYVASEDTRLQRVLDSCTANGVDPTTLGLGDPTNRFASSVNVEISTGGSLTLTEERSKAKTYGVIFEQPFTDEFELTLSMTRFSIEVSDSISEPSNQFIVNQCFNNPEVPDGSSGFCSRITRGDDGSIELLDASFINVGLITSKGVDYNIYYKQDFVVGDNNLGVTFDMTATNLKEQYFQILDTEDDNAGEPAYPDWRADARLSLEYSDFRLTWRTQFIGGGEADNPGEFDPDGTPCDGLAQSCRPVYWTEDYFRHDVALSYNFDNMFVAVGVRNVFNDAPNKVDGGGVFSVRNFPLGVGYDVFGRTAYMNFGAKF
ncbi:TonB-dependent receptor domain-containing protein [Bowmanella sp. JS7-9]|uniref:TonB-dependent receptor domain-containing protein n=1 Tax=Pseudobowmanella zhangzhouensis TaxID=1537679 RepID=A0ABW1XQC9_9ALTE|nr:TonB-dependent receptor [Bowmanella sp. JS7-9]TBX22005.1 TonB-dependent receptor [Bowmanella sp. JS7-9]